MIRRRKAARKNDLAALGLYMKGYEIRGWRKFKQAAWQRELLRAGVAVRRTENPPVGGFPTQLR
jgi:hypothetical protein